MSKYGKLVLTSTKIEIRIDGARSGLWFSGGRVESEVDGGCPMLEGEPRKVVTVEEVEELISMLPTVLKARVNVNDWGLIEEIHVLSTIERSGKQVVRDIESALAARWGIKIDHKKISVAQLVGIEPTLPPKRLKVQDFQIFHNLLNPTVRCRVTLVDPDDQDEGPVWEGTTEGPGGAEQILRMAGSATIDAINGSVPEGHYFVLESAGVVASGGRDVAVTTVTYLMGPDNQELLAGAAVVYGDPVEAVIRASLDAVNRKTGWLPLRKPIGGEVDAGEVRSDQVGPVEGDPQGERLPEDGAVASSGAVEEAGPGGATSRPGLSTDG